jgi:hypothetical protein
MTLANIEGDGDVFQMLKGELEFTNHVHMSRFHKRGSNSDHMC